MPFHPEYAPSARFGSEGAVQQFAARPPTDRIADLVSSVNVEATMEWTPDHLVNAIKQLFEQNLYAVTGPKHVHGAEIDLVAEHSSPFAHPIYIEATIEYVNTEKYGKDLSKLALLRVKEPTSELMIVSAKGFTNEVRERATETRIVTLTFEELLRRFERFAPYIDYFTGDTDTARALRELEEVYEEPQLVDDHGTDIATDFLSTWARTPDKRQWLILVGEYGTGKTALTKILQRRWLEAHVRDPSHPIPFRIELRDFVRQFDGRGLLHHFLDKHRLAAIPVDYVQSLIRNGRIVLLLDGYDEMAQYMHARERRTCLEALAELSKDGARGLLTTRPNYFSEAEELHVLETLYKGISTSALDISARDKVDHERRLDHFFDSYFIKRYERSLRDLTIDQTQRLVQKSLPNDKHGQESVLRILNRVSRTTDGAKTTLSGKPVIISYLLNVVEGLKGEASSEEYLSEFQVFKMILDKLMLRDYGRSPVLTPAERRTFLQRLALVLSVRGLPGLAESDLKSLVAEEMRPKLARLPAENAQQELEILFADLRGSATLTRVDIGVGSQWAFSHNSLREFLVLERVREDLEQSREPTASVKANDAMRALAASIDDDDLAVIRSRLATLWQNPSSRSKNGYLLGLFWDGFLRMAQGSQEEVCRSALVPVVGPTLEFSQAVLQNVSIDNASFDGARFSEAELTRVSFKGASLQKADFSGALLDGVSFEDADLRGAMFGTSIIADVDFRQADLAGADFRGSSDMSILIQGNEGSLRLTAESAIGWLKSQGALTDSIPIRNVVTWHALYPIFIKIVEKLLEGNWRQVRGLAQRGASQSDPRMAMKILDSMTRRNYIEWQTRRNAMVKITTTGRQEFSRFVSGEPNAAEFDKLLQETFE